MSSNNNISPMGAGKGNKQQLSEERLMAYLAGNLTPAEQHEVEEWLADEGMESDAVEGLQLMQPAERLHSVHRLNHGLRKKTGKRTRRTRKAGAGPNVIVAVLLLLLLVAAAFLVLRYLL